jgi:hypothetical protein
VGNEEALIGVRNTIKSVEECAGTPSVVLLHASRGTLRVAPQVRLLIKVERGRQFVHRLPDNWILPDSCQMVGLRVMGHNSWRSTTAEHRLVATGHDQYDLIGDKDSITHD